MQRYLLTKESLGRSYPVMAS